MAKGTQYSCLPRCLVLGVYGRCCIAGFKKEKLNTLSCFCYCYCVFWMSLVRFLLLLKHLLINITGKGRAPGCSGAGRASGVCGHLLLDTWPHHSQVCPTDSSSQIIYLCSVYSGFFFFYYYILYNFIGSFLFICSFCFVTNKSSCKFVLIYHSYHPLYFYQSVFRQYFCFVCVCMCDVTKPDLRH